MWLTIAGAKPYDGRYEFVQPDAYTIREWGWVRRLTGYLPAEVEKGIQGGDAELFAVLAIIALHRAGRIEAGEVPTVFERLGDATFGTFITIEGDPAELEPEDDAGPPEPSSNGSSSSSGDDTKTSSDPSTEILPASGMGGSATSASPPTWSAT